MTGLTHLLARWMRLDDDDENSSVCNDEVKIPMFIKKKGQNSSVWKDMMRIKMFLKTGLEFQCL